MRANLHIDLAFSSSSTSAPRRVGGEGSTDLASRLLSCCRAFRRDECNLISVIFSGRRHRAPPPPRAAEEEEGSGSRLDSQGVPDDQGWSGIVDDYHSGQYELMIPGDD